MDTPEEFADSSPPLPTELRSFLTEHRRSFIVTLRRDGSPTAHAMTALDAGDALLFNTYRKSAKTRNIQRDPRVCAVYLDGYESETPSGFAVEGTAGIHEANEMPGTRGDAPVSEDVARRATDRLQSGKRILIHVTPERIRPLGED